MIYKTRSPKSGHVRIVFELPPCIWADRIYLAGNFNDWREDELCIQQERDGAWRLTLDLPAGTRYEFRYIVDGQWRTDYHADGCTMNPFGTQNSVIDAALPIETGSSPAEPQANGLLSSQIPASKKARTDGNRAQAPSTTVIFEQPIRGIELDVAS